MVMPFSFNLLLVSSFISNSGHCQKIQNFLHCFMPELPWNHLKYFSLSCDVLLISSALTWLITKFLNVPMDD